MNIAAWLRYLGLERYEQAFLERDIRADALPDLTEPDLEKLGIALGDCKRGDCGAARSGRALGRKRRSATDFQYDVSFNPRRRR